MSSKFKKLIRSSSGFTIIEVVIVLAIAALILLIVFLAVPALQRNSRNTQYRSEAARILAVTQEAINNANGVMPGVTGPPAGPTGATIQALANTKNITTVTALAPLTATQQTPNLTTAFVDSGVKCGTIAATTVTPTTTNAPARGLIVIYAIEDSSGSPIAQCTES